MKPRLLPPPAGNPRHKIAPAEQSRDSRRKATAQKFSPICLIEMIRKLIFSLVKSRHWTNASIFWGREGFSRSMCATVDANSSFYFSVFFYSPVT
jgi:hypothetical protein